MISLTFSTQLRFCKMTRYSLYGRSLGGSCIAVLPIRRAWLTERVWLNFGSSSKWKMTSRKKRSCRSIRRMPASVYNIVRGLFCWITWSNTWEVEYKLKQKLIHRITERGNKPEIILNINRTILSPLDDTWVAMRYKLGWVPVQSGQSKRTSVTAERE